MRRRVLSMLICLVMLIGIFPTGISAAEASVAEVTLGEVTTEYDSFYDAISAADDEALVKLLSDVTLSGGVTIDKAITLDLNEKTLDGTSLSDISLRFNNANATVKNGTIKGSRIGAIATENDSNVTLDDVIATTVSDGSAMAVAVTVGRWSNVTIESGDYQGLLVYPNGDATLNGGTFRPFEGGFSICRTPDESMDYGKNYSRDCTLLLGEGKRFTRESHAPTGTCGGFTTVVNVEDGDPYITIAQIGDVEYVSLEEALAVAEEGDIVRLKVNTVAGNGIIYVDNPNNITLDLGVASFTTSGDYNLYVDSASGGLTVQNGKIDCGTAYINSYDTTTLNTTINGPIEALGNVKFIGGKYTGGVMIYDDNRYGNGANVAFAGGEFDKGSNSYNIKSEEKQLSAFLANDYKFWTDDTTVLDLSDSMETAEKVAVKLCTHNWENGECTICREQCSPHSFGENGVCEKCGYVCPHNHVTKSDDGVCICDDCTAQMAVAVNGRYYAKSVDRGNADNTLKAAIDAAADGSTVKLLTDGLLANAYVTGGKTITLELNGKKLIETGQGITVGITDADGKNEKGTLIVNGEGSSEDNGKWMMPYAFRVINGTLKFGGSISASFDNINVGGGELISDREKPDCLYIGTLEIADVNAKMSFRAGIFGKIVLDPTLSGSFKLGTLLKEEDGKAFIDGNGEYVRYDTLISKDDPVENVKIGGCRHESLAEENTCNYCGYKRLVAIFISDGGAIGTLTPADEWTESAINTAANNAVDTWGRFGGTFRLFVDFTLGNKTYSRDYHDTIDLNGHKITGGSLKVRMQGIATLTIKDDSEGEPGMIENVHAEEGTLIVKGVEVSKLSVSSGARVQLKDGSSFKKISLPAGVTIADCLEPGTYICDSDGIFNPEYLKKQSLSFENAYTVKPSPVTVTENDKSGSVPYYGAVPTELFPTVTTNDGSSPNLTYEWCAVIGTDVRTLATATPNGNGGYTWDMAGTCFGSLNVGDEFGALCIITAKDGDKILWGTVVNGYTLTMTHGDLADAAVTPLNEESLVYTPYMSRQLDFSVKHGETPLSMGTHYTIKDDSDTAVNAGEYTLVLEGCGKYAGSTLEYKWTVKPRELDDISKFTKAYDGTDALPENINFSYDGGSITLTSAGENPDYSVSGNYHSAAAGATKGADVTVTLKNGNYTFSGGKTKTFLISEGDGKAEIAKAAPPAERIGEMTVYNNRTAYYSYDVTGLLPQLGDGKSLGTVEYSETWTLSNSSYTVTEINLDEHGQLRLRAEAPDETAEGEIGSFTIAVRSDNYHDFNIILLVNAENRIVPVGEPTLSKDTITYGEAVNTVALSGAMKSGNEDVTGVFEWINGSVEPEAGSYDAQWHFTPDNTIYSEVTGFAPLKVNKADRVYVAPAARTLIYNGGEQALVTEGTTQNGGTMLYSTDGASWSEAVPKRTNADSYTVYYKIDGDKNHNDAAGSVDASIAKKAIEGASVGAFEAMNYNGESRTPRADVTIDGLSVSGEWSPVLNVGDTTDFTANGNFTGTITGQNPGMAKKAIEGASVGAFEAMTYNGANQTPRADVTIDGLSASGEWSPVLNVGDTTDFTANGNFIGTITGLNPGMAKRSISDAAIALAENLIYNGSEQTQNVTVALDGLTVTYDVSGNKATEVKQDGSYTLTVTANGNFDGSKNVDWNITPARPVENSEKQTAARVKKGRVLEKATVTYGEFFGLDGATVLEGTFSWVDGTKAVRVSGTEQMTFSPNDKNYSDVTFDVAVKAYSSSGSTNTAATNTVATNTAATNTVATNDVTYTVSFETNGGSDVSDVKVSKEGKVKEPAEPTKEGFDFAGWFTDKRLKTEYDFSEKVTGSFTLYAKWTEKNGSEKGNTEKDNSKNQIILTIDKTEAKVFGKTKANDVAPKIENDRTMLPARFVAESLGAKVSWDGEKKLVTIVGKNAENEEVTILITIGEENALVNGKEVKLDSPAFIENDRTYTPIRFIAETLGAEVSWDSENRTVTMTKPDSAEEK